MSIQHQHRASFSPSQSFSFTKCLVRTTSKSVYPVVYYLQLYLRWYIAISLILWLMPAILAQDDPNYMNEPILNCTSNTDQYVGNAQIMFSVRDWIDRGLCVRQGTGAGGTVKTFQCYSRLQLVIANNLNEIRKAEYNGAAGVLALLPTIGALLGTPTNEIWRLLTMIPFGGLLALACSFGGAMLPVKIKDYESDFMKKNIKGDLRSSKSAPTLRLAVDDYERSRIERRADILLKKVHEKLQNNSQEKVPKMYILVGLTGMCMLLASAQVAMTIIELGAVLPWWCISKWWVHLWYLMVIISAGIDSYVQLPFSKQWRLCLSDVPYDLVVARGDCITTPDSDKIHAVDNIKIALRQLRSLKRGTVHFSGRKQLSAEPRNVLFVHVSVTSQKHDWRRTFIRSVSKITSIAVFIVGTAEFASAQLLSIAMATFTLTTVLGAGIFGRAITSWIVAGIETAEPMIHFVANHEDEAHYVLARLFMINNADPDDPNSRRIQLELHGHIFLEGRRIATRWRWPSWILGILRRPYDMARAVSVEKGDEPWDIENLGSKNNAADHQPLIRPIPTARSTMTTDTIESISLKGMAIPRKSLPRSPDSVLTP